MTKRSLTKRLAVGFLLAAVALSAFGTRALRARASLPPLVFSLSSSRGAAPVIGTSFETQQLRSRFQSLADPASALRRWIERSARAVSLYLGRFPVDRVSLAVYGGRSQGVHGGVTYGSWGDSDPSIRVLLGRDTTLEDLDDDWVLPHELLHLGLPDLPEAHSWFGEGAATYVEPLARARLGLISEDRFWSELWSGLPQGLPGLGDRGLDRTRAWGRTYWGGALYFLLADVEIRTRTRGRLSLRDALAGILAKGGDIDASWTIDRTVQEGDRALGLPILRGLYERLGTASESVDLPALFRRLGVRVDGDAVSYDEAAPLAPTRRAITTAETSPRLDARESAD